MRTFSLAFASVLLACRAEAPKDLGTVDTAAVDTTDADGDGFSADEGDCDDTDAATWPGAIELCDGADQNCDGQVDDGVQSTWYADDDGDGFGDPDSGTEACEAPAGTVAQGTDCDDADPDAFPSAQERCDGVDNDCDGNVDEDLTVLSYADADGDGFGDDATAIAACEGAAGRVSVGGDCDDTRADARPGGFEVCDEIDNDCNGVVDEGVTRTWYADADGDGWGIDGATEAACDLPTGYAPLGGDCDDADSAYHPGATESCDDARDLNCDGSVAYADADADGWAACTDCDDTRADVRPDATETCNDRDDDCDGALDDTDADLDSSSATSWYLDADTDGYGRSAGALLACEAPSSYVAREGDCADLVAAVNPGASEVCNDVDDDCDGVTDDADASLDTGTASTWYTDSDADGIGSTLVLACDAPAGSSTVAGDCDDTRPGVRPGATEVCNGLDDDCDGTVDLGASDATGWYVDTDGDGYGDVGGYASGCTPPAASTTTGTDCDDADLDAFPGALERLDGFDDDCDGAVDEAAVAVVFKASCTGVTGSTEYTPVQTTAFEEAALRGHLATLALGVDRYDEPAGGWSPSVATLTNYDLVIYSDCGWSWGATQQPMVDALLGVQAVGIPTLMLGDDLAWTSANVTGEERLTLLNAASGNGSASQTVTPTGSHAALAYWVAAPSAFTYPMDIDFGSAYDGSTVVLATASGAGQPAWLVREDPTTGVRAASINMSVYFGNHMSVGSGAEPQLAAMFTNSAAWALGL